jgi:hypothetical protein
MCLIFSEPSIPNIFHWNKYIASCTEHACTDMCRSLCKVFIIVVCLHPVLLSWWSFVKVPNITLHINPFSDVKSRYRQTRHVEANTEFLQLFVVSMPKTGWYFLLSRLFLQLSLNENGHLVAMFITSAKWSKYPSSTTSVLTEKSAKSINVQALYIKPTSYRCQKFWPSKIVLYLRENDICWHFGQTA